MKKDAIIARLKKHQDDFRRLGVTHLYLFGSVARGDDGKHSDVDLFFDYEKGKFGLFELMEVKDQATGILQCKADIMARASLHPILRERIEASAIQVF